MARDVRPGITFAFNGQDVSLEQVAAATQNGVDFRLSAPVDFGTVTDFIQTVAGMIADLGITGDVDVGAKIRSLPYPLDSIIGRLLCVHVRLEEFELHLPPSPTGTPDPSNIQGRRFNIGLSGTWEVDPARADETGPITVIPGPSG